MLLKLATVTEDGAATFHFLVTSARAGAMRSPGQSKKNRQVSYLTKKVGVAPARGHLWRMSGSSFARNRVHSICMYVCMYVMRFVLEPMYVEKKKKLFRLEFCLIKFGPVKCVCLSLGIEN
jgi:hypothetical protein